MKVGDLVKVMVYANPPIGIIVSRHKEAHDPLYFVLIDGYEYPYRQDQLEVIA